MKTKWIILLLVFGLLFFGLGCKGDSVAVEGFGAIALFPGLLGLFEKIWPSGDEPHGVVVQAGEEGRQRECVKGCRL